MELRSPTGRELLIPIYRCPGDPQLLVATRLGEMAIGTENQLELDRECGTSISFLHASELGVIWQPSILERFASKKRSNNRLLDGMNFGSGDQVRHKFSGSEDVSIIFC